MKQKILIVFGTRPEAIKMIPLIFAFGQYADIFETKVCVTGQHREMLDKVLSFFSVKPDYDLDLMRENQSLVELSARIMLGIKEVLVDYNPDFVFVHGDTTTAMITALASFYQGIKVCHVEAGLRTYNKYSPYPEEINRQIITKLADKHFAPTLSSKTALLDEKIKDEDILVTGNTVIDSLLLGLKKVTSTEYSSNEISFLKNNIDFSKKIVLVTGHRRENFGEGFTNVCNALSKISELPNVQVVYPVHLNPNVLTPVSTLLADKANILLCPPLDYPTFIWLMKQSYIILTDSGGIQEEAPSLGKPVLVMRDITERPEAVNAGTVKLVGTDSDLIFSETLKLISDENEYKKRSQLTNPYGDGTASAKIVEYMLNLS